MTCLAHIAEQAMHSQNKVFESLEFSVVFGFPVIFFYNSIKGSGAS